MYPSLRACLTAPFCVKRLWLCRKYKAQSWEGLKPVGRIEACTLPHETQSIPRMLEPYSGWAWASMFGYKYGPYQSPSIRSMSCGLSSYRGKTPNDQNVSIIQQETSTHTRGRETPKLVSRSRRPQYKQGPQQAVPSISRRSCLDTGTLEHRSLIQDICSTSPL